MAAGASGFDHLLTAPRPAAARRYANIGARLAAGWLGAAIMAPRLGREARLNAINRWAKSMTRDLSLAVVSCGPAQPLQNRAVLFVANHVSWLDICAIASLTGTLFVAKAEVGRWPVIGRMATNFGNFLHERGNLRDAARVKLRVATALLGDWPVTIFPEGTTGWGTSLGPFYPALTQAAIDAATPVQAVAIRYRDTQGQPSRAAPFVGDQTFVASLRGILREPLITAELRFSAPFAASGLTRREITRHTQHFIAEALDVEESHAVPDPRRLRACAPD